MSLTSYRAAPPRDSRSERLAMAGVEGMRRESWGVIGGPGGDLLFRALRRSTIGAEGFHGRVRDGIGCYAPRYGHQAVQSRARPSEHRELLVERGPRTRVRGPAEASLCVSSEGKGLPPWLSAK